MHTAAHEPAPGYEPLAAEEGGVVEKPTLVPVSTAWIYALCVCNFGISAAWALEFAVTTPFFAGALEAGPVVSHAVWVIGPLSGLIVAPIVGSLSDRCTSRWGRRRPFILGGMVTAILGMAMFANAKQLGAALFPANSKVASILIAIVAFSIMDLAVNTTMWPTRAIQGDLVPDFQQHAVQSASVVMGSVGDLSVQALLNYFDEPVAHIRFAFLVIGTIFMVTIVTLLVAAKEVPVEEDDEGLARANQQSLNVLTYMRGLPPWLWSTGAIYSGGFFTLFCTLPNASSWLGSTVLHGDPMATKGTEKALAYESGVSTYGRAGVLRAILQLIFSAAYPTLLKYTTAGQLLGAAFGGFGVLLIFLSSTGSKLMGELVVAAMAIPMASLFTLPVAITVENSDTANRGRYLGALNCFAVIPQLIDTVYTGYISKAFGEAWVMRIGAMWAMITGIGAVAFMREV